MSYLGEFKRRKVFQVAAVYAVVAWLLVQIIVSIEEPLSLPGWVDTLVIVLLAIGFPITLIISWAFNLTPEGLVRDEGSTSVPHGGRRIEYILIGLLIVAVGWIGYRELGPSEETIPQVLPNSVAVLLCDSFSTDPENEFFAASLHEELLNQLVKLRNLNVIARTSVLQYADAERPITEIADELRVESIMECSVAYGDGQIVISAQLIDGDTGLHLWSERYHREFVDIFGIQADIAVNVANALDTEFSSAERSQIERSATTSPEAYEFYLQALAILDVSQSDPRVQGLLDQALELDPEFALAHAHKAWLYGQTLANSITGSAVDSSSRRALEALIRRHAEIAIDIDPHVPFAHTALADMYQFGWRWSEAHEEYSLAIEAAPSDFYALGNYSHLLATVGSHREANRLARQAVDLNPNIWNAHFNLGAQLGYAGDHEAALTSLQIAAELAPVISLPRSWLAYIQIALGNPAQALEELRLAERLMGDSRILASLPGLAYAYSFIGESEEAERIFNEIDAIGLEDQAGAGTWAMAYLAIGDQESSLEWLEMAAETARNHEVDAGYYNLRNLKLNVLEDPILEQPEFVDVLNRIRGD